MRKKPVKKGGTDRAKELPAQAKASTPVTSVRDPNSAELWPMPESLYREAEAEPDYRSLEAYADVIGVLRQKGFSYREIAEWFSERGVPVDHNAVYRTYTNTLTVDQAQQDAEDEALREQARRE